MEFPLAIIVVIALLVAVAVFTVLRRGRRKPTVRQCEWPVNLCVLLDKPLDMDSDEIARAFVGRWGAGAVCRETDSSDPQRRVRNYLLTCGLERILITINQFPIPARLRDLILQSALGVTDEQENSVAEHQATVRIRCEIDDRAVPIAKLAAKTLLTFLNLPEAVGYVNVAAQLYKPKETFGRLLNTQAMDAKSLFALLANMQAVRRNEHLWIHTHGMEQFGLADIEVRFTGPENAHYYQSLVANTALYALDHGPVLNIGDTAELAGDGVAFTVKIGASNSSHPYGRCGSIELVRA